jgi:amidase
MLGLQSPRDSTVVASLRKAGVVVLGKAAMSEWASARSSRNSTSNGWSGYGRQVLGAYHENQDPLGSSSGSGVSVSVGLAMASLGTEVCIISSF